MNMWERIKFERAERRRMALEAARARIAARARAEGLEIRLFGSMARGRVFEGSDLDILVMPHFPSEERYRIKRWMEDIAMELDVPIDVAFADQAPELARDSVACL